MAAVLVATPFVRSKAMRSQAFVADVGGVPAQKRLRVSCRQAASGRVMSDVAIGGAEEIHVFQPSSAQDTLSDWIVSYLLKEDVPEQAVAAPEPVVVAPKALQVVEPVLEATKQVERRRSERKPVVFTQEMARRLRKENRATQSFHDKWYHSAIASRLAIPE